MTIITVLKDYRDEDGFWYHPETIKNAFVLNNKDIIYGTMKRSNRRELDPTLVHTFRPGKTGLEATLKILKTPCGVFMNDLLKNGITFRTVIRGVKTEPYTSNYATNGVYREDTAIHRKDFVMVCCIDLIPKIPVDIVSDSEYK